MAEIGGELGVTRAFAAAEEGEGELAVLFGREEPVAGEADDERIGLDGGEGFFEGAVRLREVELVEGARDVEVRVCVEAVDEALALMAQVALDLELDVERVGVAGGGVFFAAAEFAVHGRVGDVGDVGHHAGDGEADARAGVLGVVAAVPGGVLHDGLAADLVEGDGLGAFAAGGGHGEDAAGEVGEVGGEAQREHAAHGAADDGVEFRDAEVVEEEFLRAHHVADGDEGKLDPVGAAGFGVEGGRAGGALAAAEDVGADDEEAAGVDGLAGADEVVPPAGFFVGRRVPAGGVVVAAEGVADEDGVVARGVEGAVGFVAEGEGGEGLTAAERKGFGMNEIARGHEADLAGRKVARRRVRGGSGGQGVDLVSHRAAESTTGDGGRQGSGGGYDARGNGPDQRP